MFGCMLCLLVTARSYDWGGSVLIIRTLKAKRLTCVQCHQLGGNDVADGEKAKDNIAKNCNFVAAKANTW